MMRLLARLLAAVLFLTLAVDASAAEAATRPSAPRSVRATPLNLAVKVTWAAPSSNGGASIDQYAVQRRTSTTASWVTVKRTSASARSWTSTGLTNGRKYYFRVLAHNRRGYGTASATVSATPRTVPSSPRDPAATTRLLSFSFTWTGSANNGGAVIDSYLTEISTDGATWTTPKIWKPGNPAPLFTGLIAGKEYYFRVRAHNAAGYSVGTNAGPYRAYLAPSPVTGLDAVSGNSQVALTWVKPVSGAEQGLPAPSLYKIEKSSNNGPWTEVGTTSNTFFTATGLYNGTTYDFRVSARSSSSNLGYGPADTASATPTGPPTVPQNIVLGWDEISGQNRLSWDAPLNDGGPELVRYEAQHWNEGTPLPYDVTNLLPDATSAPAPFAETDTMHIRACNALGCGPWSADIGPIPGGVQNASATDTSDGTAASVTLDWDLPANDAVAPPTSYTVSRSTDDGLIWTVLGPTTETTFVDDTADYGTTYKYRVVANGANGSGTWVFTEVTTQPSYVLDTSTTALQVTEGGDNTFQVTLDPVVQADTVITVSSSNPLAASTDPTVTIPMGSSSANVTIDGVPDLNLTNESVTITLQYGTQTKQVTVTVNDDDTQAIVVDDSTVTVTEGGSQIVGVSLAFKPTGTVTVNVGSDDTDTATVSPSFVTFTPGNYNVPQSVTINGVAAGLAAISLTSTGVTTTTVDVTVESP
ncbi:MULTISPECIES: fibronectin type III domain-containing protein [unclassified Nocardioides]|uniref:fibronectin type III domain-containing protein n=1 Tax=unclassified Nocardioides TaxID=2615069 RepID=UPI000ABD3285|nr:MULTISPECIES: fibronectin type III domain-containing protein [unclassified Nocardioides]